MSQKVWTLYGFQLFWHANGVPHSKKSGNSLDKLRHPKSDAYSAEQVLLNKQQISGGGAYPDCYQKS